MAKGVKTQIVLDADVVIHFSKGDLLSLLPSIFPDYEYVLLEVVHEELLSDIRTQIDNLRDIRAYCEEKKIVYLTTIDFLWYAWRKGLLTPAEISAFIAEVKQKGSKLPEIEIEKYVCETIL